MTEAYESENLVYLPTRAIEQVSSKRSYLANKGQDSYVQHPHHYETEITSARRKHAWEDDKEYHLSTVHRTKRTLISKGQSQKENRIRVNEMTQWVKSDDSVGLPHKYDDPRSIPELSGKKNQTLTSCPVISTYILWHANTQAHQQPK